MPASANDTAYEPTTSQEEVENYLAQLLQDPEARKEYDRAYREATRINQIIRQCEEERERAQLSKAELAELAGINYASLRRLLTSDGSNPTFRTMLNIFDALGLEFSLKRRSRHKRQVRIVDGRVVRRVKVV